MNGMNNKGIEYFVAQITNEDFSSSANSSKFESIERSRIVRIGRGKRVSTLLKASTLLVSHIRQQNTKESIVIYRSIGGALLYLFMRLAGIKFKAAVYDSDGLAIQERIETGVWKKFGVKTVLAKSIEFFGIVAASKILVRSHETISEITSRKLVFGKKSFCVLDNGRDIKMFSPETSEVRQSIRSDMGFNAEDFILIYAGTIGDQYMVSEMRKVFEEIKVYIPYAKFLILTYAEDRVVEKYFGSEESRLDSDIFVSNVSPDLVGRAICIGDVGLSLRLSIPSMNHVAPLKYREYLLSGVPVIYSGNTGDQQNVSSLVARELDPKRPSSYIEVASWASEKIVNNREELRFEARKYGLEKFDILKDSLKLTKFLNES
jgi:hypothetical protein